MLVFLIIFAVLAVVLFLVFSGISRALNREATDEYDRSRAKRIGRLRFIVPGFLVLVMLVVSLVSGIHIIDSTEVGVVRTFGEINRQITSGLNLVNPVSDSVTTYDLRVHVRQAAFASYTKDAQPLTASIEYQYALDPAYVMDVAREYGSYEILETKLDNVVQERAKIVFAKYSINSDGVMKWEEQGSSNAAIYEAINHPEHIVKVISLSDQEIETIKAIKNLFPNVEYVERIKNSDIVGIGNSENGWIADINNALFPSLNPGDSIDVNEALAGGLDCE